MMVLGKFMGLVRIRAKEILLLLIASLVATILVENAKIDLSEPKYLFSYGLIISLIDGYSAKNDKGNQTQ